MSALGGLRTRTVRKVEPPRPRKSLTKYSSSSEPVAIKFEVDNENDLLILMNAVTSDITNHNFDDTLTNNIIALCTHLKLYGPLMENTAYQSPLDESFLLFREIVVSNHLDYRAKLCLLEIVELREQKWKSAASDITNYYQSRGNDTLAINDDANIGPNDSLRDSTSLLSSHQSVPKLSLDDVIKTSGKFPKPLKLSGKNYFKDEIIIRNADSGKVMGIKGRRVHMIEQISETIISFQRVAPTAKERIVQITGATEDKIRHAVHLMSETIKNNVSPVPEYSDFIPSNNDEFDEPGFLLEGEIKPEYKHKVVVNDTELIITGNNYNYVTMAKTVLDEFFSNWMPASTIQDNFSTGNELFSLQFDTMRDASADFSRFKSSDVEENINDGLKGDFDDVDDFENVFIEKRVPYKYSVEVMKVLAESELSRQKPNRWEFILSKYPQIVRSTNGKMSYM